MRKSGAEFGQVASITSFRRSLPYVRFASVSDWKDGHGDIYVGRVTMKGHRYFHIFTSDTADSWSPRLAALGDEHNYRLFFDLRPDATRWILAEPISIR